MDTVLWVKSLHIIAVISWMAGLLYLPRLMVYHSETDAASELSQTFKIMERRLVKVIMNPAMVIVWVAGFTTGYLQDQLLETWFLLKMVLVIGLTIVHMMLVKYVREFAEDCSNRDARYFRIINEVPTVLMIIIVLLVILKPF